MLNLLTAIVTEAIENISVDLCYHVLNFKFRWEFRGIEGKDVSVGVNKLDIFPDCNPFYF